MLSVEDHEAKEYWPVLSVEDHEAKEYWPVLSVEDHEAKEHRPVLSVEDHEAKEYWPVLSVEDHEAKEYWPVLSVEDHAALEGPCQHVGAHKIMTVVSGIVLYYRTYCFWLIPGIDSGRPWTFRGLVPASGCSQAHDCGKWYFV